MSQGTRPRTTSAYPSQSQLEAEDKRLTEQRLKALKEVDLFFPHKSTLLGDNAKALRSKGSVGMGSTLALQNATLQNATLQNTAARLSTRESIREPMSGALRLSHGPMLLGRRDSKRGLQSGVQSVVQSGLPSSQQLNSRDTSMHEGGSAGGAGAAQNSKDGRTSTSGNLSSELQKQLPSTSVARSGSGVPRSRGERLSRGSSAGKLFGTRQLKICRVAAILNSDSGFRIAEVIRTEF
jgi:hypothetical protein